MADAEQAVVVPLREAGRRSRVRAGSPPSVPRSSPAGRYRTVPVRRADVLVSDGSRLASTSW